MKASGTMYSYMETFACFEESLDNQRSTQGFQQQVRQLDRVIAGLKKLPCIDNDEKHKQQIHGLLDKVGQLVWRTDLDSKTHRKIHRVLAELEKHCMPAVLNSLQAFTKYLDDCEPHQIHYFATWSQLLEQCQAARQLVRQHLSSVLNTLAHRLQKEVSCTSPWTVDRQQRLHMLSKWVLQLSQHLASDIKQLVWSYTPGQSDGTEFSQEDVSNMGVILGALLTVLTDQEVNIIMPFPKDCVMLAGTVVGFILNLCPDSRQQMASFLQLLPNKTSSCQHTCLYIGRIALPHKKHVSINYTLGHLALTNGLLSCASLKFLCAMVPDKEADGEEENTAAAAVLFHIVAALCQENEFKFHGFKMLLSWFKSILKVIPQLVMMKQYYFSRKSVLKRKALEIVWTHLDSPVEGVNECVNEVFEMLLELQRQEQNLITSLQCCSDGNVSDQVALGTNSQSLSDELQYEPSKTASLAGDFNAAVPLRQMQCSSGVSSDQEDDQMQCLLDRVLQLSWQVKGKYSLLAVVLKYIDAKQFLSSHPEVWRHLLDCMGTNYLSPVATQLYKAIVTALSCDSQNGAALWEASCLPWVVKALCSKQSLLKHYICHQWLPWTLKVVRGSHDLLLQRLRSHGNGADTLHGQVAVLKVARNLQLLQSLPRDILHQAIFHPDEDVRLTAFCVICVSSKKSEPLQTVEIALLKAGLPLTMNSDSAPFRQQLQTYLRSAIVRLRDSVLAGLRESGTESTMSGYVLNAVEFLNRLWNLCISNLHPGCNFQRLKTSLEWTSVILESFVYDPMRTQKKGGCPEETKELLKFVHKHGQWQFHTTQSTTVLLSCLLHGTDEVREMAAHLLLHYFPWPIPLGSTPGASSQPAMLGLLQRSLDMCNSPRARDCESGAVLTIILFQKHIVPNRLQMEPPASGDSETHSVSTQRCASQEEAAVNFYQYLLTRTEQSLKLAKRNIPTAVKQSPAHGFILALRRCLSEVPIDSALSSDCLQPIVSKLINIISDIINLVLCVLGGPVKDSETAPSFQQMSLSIGEIIAESAECTEASTMEGEGEGEGEDAAEDNTALSPQHQMVMTWCWLNIRECSILLGKLPGLEKMKECLSYEDVDAISATFFKILTKCRHRGAIEGCNQGFIKFCTTLLRSSDERLYSIPAQILKQVMSQVTERSRSSVTRRSAGLPLIVQSIVASESKLRQTSLLSSVVNQLLEILSRPIPDHDQLVDLPQIHAMNILKAVFRESTVSMGVLPFISPATIHAIKGFASPIWAIRNAATQLFGTLVTRMLGQQKTRSDNLHTTTAAEFFAQYPQLQQYLLAEVRQVLPKDAEDAGDATSAAAAVAGSVQLHPTLFPVLTILAKLGSGVTSEEKRSVLEDFLHPVQYLASSAIYAVRDLAAKALVPLVPQQCLLSHISETVCQLPAAREQCVNSNHLHGQLLQLEKLTDCLSERDAESQKMRQCYQELARKSWLLLPSSNRCSLLRAKYIKVLDAMATKTEEDATGSDLEGTLQSWMDWLLKPVETMPDRQVGQSTETREVTRWLLGRGSNEELDSRISLFLRCDTVTVQLTCVQWLQEMLDDDDDDGDDRRKISWKDILADILSLCNHRDSDLRCESLQVFLLIYRNITDADTAQKWPDLLSAGPVRNFLEGWMEQAIPDTRPGALTVAVSAIFCQFCSQFRSDQLSKWSEQLAHHSKPCNTPLLRLHFAHALNFAGGSLWRWALEEQDRGGSDDILYSLYKAATHLLVDEDPQTRTVAASFVQQLPRQPADAQIAAIHSSMALKILQENVKDLLGRSPSLAVKLFETMSPTETLSSLVSHLSDNHQIETMFEAQDINPYEELVVLHELVVDCLCDCKGNLDSDWCEEMQTHTLRNVQQAAVILHPLCTEDQVLNVTHYKKVFEHLHALLSQGRLLARWYQSHSKGHDPRMYQTLHKVVNLHPRLKSAVEEIISLQASSSQSYHSQSV